MLDYQEYNYETYKTSPCDKFKPTTIGKGHAP